MRVNIIFTLFALLIVAGCHNTDITKTLREDYRNSKSFFEVSLVNHFPIELPDSCSFGSSVPKSENVKTLGFGIDGLELYKKYSKTQFGIIASHFKEVTHEVYSTNDTSLLLVFSFCDTYKIGDNLYKNQEPPELKTLAKHNLTVASSLPVPLFEIDEYKGNTMSGLTDDFKLYVLDARPGKYVDEKYLQECECLPEKWKHGYSKGVAMSDEQQVIIYWIVVW